MNSLFRSIVPCFALVCLNSAADVDTDANFQGISGLINVPTGDSLRYGEFNFSYNNLVDSQGGRFGPQGTQYVDGNDVSFLFSPFPGVEVGMRNISEDFDLGSDLSANLKYSPTFIPDNWFDLSVGIQDIGGATNELDATFVSVSKTWRDIRFTAGVGKQDNTRLDVIAPRFEGGFYGVEYQPFDWLGVMAEHDGANRSAGVKLKTPLHWMNHQGQFFASLVFQEDFEDGAQQDNFYFNFGFRGSLYTSDDTGLIGRKRKEYQLADTLNWLFSDSAWEDYEPIELGLSTYRHQDDAHLTQLGIIKREITRQGFERVWLGLEGQTLFVRFENSIFNRNDLDAIGVVLGIVAQTTPEDIAEVDVTLSKYDVPTFRFIADRAAITAFYKGEIPAFAVESAAPAQQQVGDMLWLGGSKSPFWVPRVSFHPIHRNFVGTEIGVLDYSLALRTNVTLPMWRGAELVADYDINLDNTEDFEFGRTFFRWQHEDGLKNLMLRQSTQLPFNVYATVAVGRTQEMIFEEHDTVAAEAMWQSMDGAHRISGYGAYLDNRVFDGQREILVGNYRYYWRELDTAFEIEAGQFWREDRGVKVSANFNFGDTRVKVFARDTDVRSIGISVSIPLTPRRDMRPGYFQVKGKDSWTYELTTRVGFDGSNPLAPQRAYRPAYLRHLERTYLNDDRLSVAYLRANQDRLRSAFLELVR